MLPVIQGLIARRVLLNFRADPEVVQKLLPRPFEAETFQGHALVGICLIRLEQIRPRSFPRWLGLASENMAHRVAVRYPSKGNMKSGVFVWRRETGQKLVQMFGGRLFPGGRPSGARRRAEAGAVPLRHRLRGDGAELCLWSGRTGSAGGLAYTAGHSRWCPAV